MGMSFQNDRIKDVDFSSLLIFDSNHLENLSHFNSAKKSAHQSLFHEISRCFTCTSMFRIPSQHFEILTLTFLCLGFLICETEPTPCLHGFFWYGYSVMMDQIISDNDLSIKILCQWTKFCPDLLNQVWQETS